ncbi:unnamed protein product [Rotaria socialis]|uniref:Uncharacterized protein n=1 Tax=Rotaria socialis TaxID=392032 RepID=A0A820YXY1_9BILA|nr:unnamed protein product [Rotaria socialis]CAF4537517.1 unnamed protein product [Rotaria socialis]CAF4555484.1 unnamed protein product [Rotaria socialis]CAF4652582.1 unnamed protein product [Rotaria socialis]CAF4880507.1 unnamed protein product [Rotaria socialis]
MKINCVITEDELSEWLKNDVDEVKKVLVKNETCSSFDNLPTSPLSLAKTTISNRQINYPHKHDNVKKEMFTNSSFQK